MTDHTEMRCRDCDGYNCDNGCAYPPKDTEMQIPDDVMEAAILAYEKCRGFDDGREYDIIARAILAERERCYGIADKLQHWDVCYKIHHVDK